MRTSKPLPSSVQFEARTPLAEWLRMVEQLLRAPEWEADDLPIVMKQTHISVLLLGRRHVVKLKKPVDFGFLDYTTIEKRQRACEDEVRLNRRLSPDTYIGVGTVIERDGRIGFSGSAGEIVDYCVWMNRLPEERMLDQLVARNEATEAIVDRVASRLSEFHRTAVRDAAAAKWGSLAQVRYNWEENFAQTASFVGRTISPPAYEAIRIWVDDWLEKRADVFERRVTTGRIVDGHGDLRCESICVQDDAIRIYDCIEFNDRFRCADVVNEAAFLAMDLDARGRPDLGYYFTKSYQERTGDSEFFALLPFYRCYRAFVRGKVLSFRLNEAEFSADEHRSAAQRATHYFELARRYATRLQQPTVIAVGGLSGTGKTSVARAIADELGLRVVSADAVRQELYGAVKQPARYGEGVYNQEANRRTYQTMIGNARQFLAEDGGVVLDATFRRLGDRAAAREMAEVSGSDFRLIECRLAPESVRARLTARDALHEGLSDANWEIYVRQQAESEPLCGPDADDCLALDTAGPLVSTAHAATDWLRQRDKRPGSPSQLDEVKERSIAR